MSPDDLFKGRPESRRIYEAVVRAIASVGRATIRTSKSQIAFRRKTGFAFVWIPGTYLRHNDVPLVLTIALRRHDASPRWKQVVEPRPGRFTHHIELRSTKNVDGQVVLWLKEAWQAAA